MGKYQTMRDLTEQEYAELRQSILEHGLLQCICYDEHNNILDGHHRALVCEAEGIDVSNRRLTYPGLTEEEKYKFSREVNIARRHLSAAEKHAHAKAKLQENPGLSDRQIAAKVGSSQPFISSIRKEMEQSGELITAISSVGADGKTRPRPVILNPNEQVQRLLKKAEVVERMVATGSSSPAYTQRRIYKEEIAAVEATPTDLSEADYIIFQRDICDEFPEIADRSVDLVLCDAPYGKDYIHLYNHLASVSGRVLRDGGSLLVMTGQAHLPKAIMGLEKSETMKYNWLISYTTPHNSGKSLNRNVFIKHKAILWYIKGRYSGRTQADVLVAPPDEGDRDLHPWGQSVGGFEDIIKRWTKPGDLVLDVFCGSGTTGVAAARCRRRFIGSDIDEKWVNVTKQRIASVLSDKKVVVDDNTDI